MVERTAAEVLAEKLIEAWPGGHVGALSLEERLTKIAARLAEDPAITVRTGMEVERFIVERHYAPILAGRDPEHVHDLLTSDRYFREAADHRIIVRRYPDATDG